MSSTRTAAAGSPVRQERYASSAVYEQGLLGNLVAKRCRTIRNPRDRALVYWLQSQSHLEGGLKLFAERFLAAFAHRIGTPDMRQIGKTPGQVYTFEEAELIYHGGLNFAAFEDRTMLYVMGVSLRSRRILDASDFLPHDSRSLRPCDSSIEEDEEAQAEAWNRLRSCTVDEAMRHCLCASKELPDFLRELCLDPAIDIEHLSSKSVWWFENIIASLHEYRQTQIEAAKQSIADTTISRKIFFEFDYALYGKGMTVKADQGRAIQIKGLVWLEGEQRIGKSTAAEAWAATHPGEVIYIRLESGKDELSFYRTISRAIGTACSSQMKAQEMRMKIEDMLQEKHLMLVIDEAHFLFPIIARPKSAPGRVDWLRTALVDHGVAVACISTPQFDRQCAHFEKGIGWNADQIKGRMMPTPPLPSELPTEDFVAVARKIVPHATAAQIDGLVACALLQGNNLAAIGHIVNRAMFLASRNGCEEFSNSHLQQAIQDTFPSLHPADPTPSPARKKAAHKARALPLQDGCNRLSDTLPTPISRQDSMDSLASVEAGFGASERLQFTEALATE